MRKFLTLILMAPVAFAAFGCQSYWTYDPVTKKSIGPDGKLHPQFSGSTMKVQHYEWAGPLKFLNLHNRNADGPDSERPVFKGSTHVESAPAEAAPVAAAPEAGAPVAPPE